MRKIAVILLALVLACGALPVSGEGGSGDAGGAVRLDFSVSFEKNALLSTYGVRVLIDGEPAAELAHGQDWDETLELLPGRHVLRFEKAGDASVFGEASFTLSGPSRLVCGIQAKREQVKVSGLRLVPLEDSPAGEAGAFGLPVFELGGSIRLSLSVTFEENRALSRYGVDLLMDGQPIAALAHGASYDAVLYVPAGLHILTFQKQGDAGVRGVSQLTVEEDTAFSCRIRAGRSKVEVTDEKLGSGGEARALSREDYIAACAEPDYESVARYPERSRGLRIAVTGKVQAVREAGAHAVVFLLESAAGEKWSVAYYRPSGEARVLEGDNVTVWGECQGVAADWAELKITVKLPSVLARYVGIE